MSLPGYEYHAKTIPPTHPRGIMSDSYNCSVCPFYTDSSKSLRLHLNQCLGFKKLQDTQEELLQRKRKRQEPRDPSIAWERLRAFNLARNNSIVAKQINTEVLVESPIDPSALAEATDTTCALLPIVENPSISSELSHTPIGQPVEYPGYEPSLGFHRDKHDTLPEALLAPLDEPTTSPAHVSPGLSHIRQAEPNRAVPYTTLPDSFGQYRVYPTKPSCIPDANCELNDVFDVHTPSNPHNMSLPHSVSEIVAPCPNISAFRLQYWHWNQGEKKSKGTRESLVRDVISAPDFVPADVIGLDWGGMDKLLATDPLNAPAGWKNDQIPVSIPPRTPASAAAYKSNPERNTLLISSRKHRSLNSTIIDAFSKNDTRFFHYVPYKAYCKDPLTSRIYEAYGEVYESQRMHDAHEAIQKLELDEPCTLPRCAAMMMLFSDATQVANFGHATAWPIRVAFGNLSKYERCKPNGSNHYEVGYMPSLPANIQETLRDLESGRSAPKAVLTHLRRELFHEVLNSLFDDEFLHAWRHGIVVCCADGITRRIFPRIFSYSADYPEKVLLATIRGMKSLQPCPRCLTPKAEFPNLGLPGDQQRRCTLKRIDNQARNDRVTQARSIIFTEGRAVNSKRVELLLKPQSYTPTKNAFSRRLRLLGFDIFESLTVDLLHEFELGVWKSVFQHILRILHSTSSKSLIAFNERFRLIPTFGDGTIRPFSEDISNMTRPAARNYEDVLQCIIPVLEGLLPPVYEQNILTLLFVLAQWHALAKLRRHTSMSIDALKHTTTRLGHELREFRRYTAEIEVYETPKEVSARQRRTRTRARPRAALTLDSDCFDEADAAIPSRQRKYFNLETSKLHSLGDYAEMIETVGTTDSISTQTGESLHRNTKRRYARTNGREYLSQMGKIERIEARLNDIQHGLRASEAAEMSMPTSTKHTLVSEDLPPTDAGRAPYQMAASQKNPVPLSLWVDRSRSDPAIKNFIPRLKNHLSARLSSQRYQDESTHPATVLSQIDIQHDRVYAHQTLKIRYTTYDVRRAQDAINPSTPKRFILVPSDVSEHSQPGSHQFWYARVLGIYHANVSHQGKRPKRMDFLWVRWLGRVLDAPGGWDSCRLDQVGYFHDSELTHAYDFVDPSDVIRAAHLIPRFLGARTTEYLNPGSSVATDHGSLGDWKNYYINRFVDRDMLMRFFGMAIGHISHKNTPECTVGISSSALESAYEYSEETGIESNFRIPDGDHEDVGLNEDDVDEDDEDDEEGEEQGGSDGDTDGGHMDMDCNDDGEMMGDWSDDNEPSW